MTGVDWFCIWLARRSKTITFIQMAQMLYSTWLIIFIYRRAPNKFSIMNGLYALCWSDTRQLWKQEAALCPLLLTNMVVNTNDGAGCKVIFLIQIFCLMQCSSFITTLVYEWQSNLNVIGELIYKWKCIFIELRTLYCWFFFFEKRFHTIIASKTVNDYCLLMVVEIKQLNL